MIQLLWRCDLTQHEVSISVILHEEVCWLLLLFVDMV